MKDCYSYVREMSYDHVGNFKNLSKAGKDAVWNTLGKLPNLLPDSNKSTASNTKSAISNGTIEVRDAGFNMQALSRDIKDSLNKLDEIFDKKKIEEPYNGYLKISEIS